MREKLSAWIPPGLGIEIGGLHAPLKVPAGCSVRYIDRLSLAELRAKFPEVTIADGEIVVDNGEILSSFPDDKLDFLIANHVFEHCERPIFALMNWLRVLREGGRIFMAVPDKEQTFDADRKITTIAHLFWEEVPPGGYKAARWAHYRDWYENSRIEKKTGAELEATVKLAIENNENIHWHVWDYRAMSDLFQWLERILPFRILTHAKNGCEVIWLLERTTAAR